MASTFVLVTGSNRGIGKGLVTKYLSRPQHIVLAGVRDPASASAKTLLGLTCGKDSRIITVTIDSGDETSANRAIDDLKSNHGIKRIDIVIANAGISNYFGKATETPPSQMLDHFKINTMGPLLLFQACASLLNEAPEPKFVVISSGAGSISGIEKLHVENTAYGASKAALNFVTRRIHAENPKIIAFPINPGWLQTELGNHAATGAGMDAAPTTVEDGVAGVVGQIDRATREKTSGRFWSYNGDEIAW